MIFSEKQIQAKAWLVTEVCNLVLHPTDQQVDKVFLISSYASGKQNAWSDLDFLIQLTQPKEWYKPRRWYPDYKLIQEINKKIDSKRIHVVFGTQHAAESLHQRHKYEKKNYAYKEIINVTNTCTPSVAI